MKGLIVLAVTASLGFAACGGVSGEDVSVDEISQCLEEGGFAIQPEVGDIIAEGAAVGAVNARTEDQGVTVVVERSDGDAQNILKQYEQFGEAFETNLEDLLEQNGPVVVLYSKTPTDEEESTVNGCQEEQGV